MSVMGVPHGNILAQLPNQIDLLINVDRHRGQYKMKVENDDTVESIVAKAMKGVPDHSRQLMYPAFISNIYQQLLEWTLHLDGIIKNVVTSLKQEREKDETKSAREIQKLRNRLLQARKIIESQVKEMSDLEDKTLLQKNEIKELQNVVKKLEHEKITKPAPVSKYDAKRVRKELDRLKSRNEHLESLAILHALEDSTDSFVVSLEGGGFDESESTSSSSEESSEKDETPSNIKTSGTKVEDVPDQKLKSEDPKATRNKIDAEGTGKKKSIEGPKATRNKIDAEGTGKKKSIVGDSDPKDTRKKVDVKGAKKKKTKKVDDRDPLEILQEAQVNLHYETKKKEKLAGDVKVLNGKLDMAKDNEMKLKKEIEVHLNEVKRLEHEAEVMKRNHDNSVEKLRKSIEDIRAKHSDDIKMLKQKSKSDAAEQQSEFQTSMNKVNEELDGVKLANKMMLEKHGVAETVNNFAQTNAVAEKINRSTSIEIEKNDRSIQTMKDATNTSSSENNHANNKSLEEKSLPIEQLLQVDEVQDYVDLKVAENLSQQKKKLTESFNKELMNANRKFLIEKEKALAETTERLKAKHSAELAVAEKMSSAKTSKAKKNARKEKTNAALATETKNLAPETTKNSSDEDEDSDLEEEKRKQYEKQKARMKEIGPKDSEKQQKFSLAAQRKIRSMAENVEAAETELEEFKAKYDATVEHVADMDAENKQLEILIKENDLSFAKEKSELKDTINSWKARFHSLKAEMQVETEDWSKKYYALEEDKTKEMLQHNKIQRESILMGQLHSLKIMCLKVCKFHLNKKFKRWQSATLFHRLRESLLWKRIRRFCTAKIRLAFNVWGSVILLDGRAQHFKKEKENIRIEFWKRQAEMQKNWTKASSESIERAVEREQQNILYQSEIKLQRAISNAKSTLSVTWNKERAEQALKLAAVKSEMIEMGSIHKKELNLIQEQMKMKWPEPPLPLYDGKDSLFTSIRENLHALKHDIHVALAAEGKSSEYRGSSNTYNSTSTPSPSRTSKLKMEDFRVEASMY